VNELPSEEARSQLSGFRRNHPNLPMIFTTRDLSIGGDLGIEKKLEMQPLTEAQMQDFVRSYVPEQAEEMLRQLKDRLREFGQTPLLLWMLCGLFQQTGEIPENLGLVFRLFTQGYERNLKQDVVIESDREWWKHVLQQLAWVMMQGEKPTEFRVAIGREEAVGAIAQSLSGKVPYAEDFARKCLRDLQKYHLIQAGTGNEELEFRHQLIQEYYAAEALLEQLPKLSDDVLKQAYLNYLKWTEPVSLILALLSETQAGRLVRAALEVDLILGARFAGETTRDLQKQSVDLLVCLEIPESLLIELLGRTQSAHAEDILISKMLDSTKLWIRKMAAWVLGEFKSEKSISSLVQALNDSNLPNLREKAAQILGRLQSPKAIPSLINALNDESVKRLRVGLRNYSSESMNSSSSEEAELDAMNTGEFWLRENAASALGSIGSAPAEAALIQALNDKDFRIREAAAYALAEIGSETAICASAKTLDGNGNFEGEKIFYDIVNLGYDFYICFLNKALYVSDLEVREIARQALETINALSISESSAEEFYYEILWNRSKFAFRLASEDDTESLMEILRDGPHQHDEAVIKMLEEIGSPSLMSSLQDLMLDTENTTILTVILAIQKRCRYYNYEIYQPHLEVQKNDRQKSQDSETMIADTITIQTVERLTIMTNKAPIFNQQQATIGVNYAAEGSKQEFTQHINATEQNFEVLLRSYKQFIDELQQENLNLTDETEITKTIDVEARRIDARWQNFLNLKRLWNGSKKAAVKVGEHFVESNPWGKGAIAFLEGVSEDVK